MRSYRKICAIAAAGLGCVALSATALTSAGVARSGAGAAGGSSPSGVATADKAKYVDLRTVQNRPTPPWNRNLFINRPTMPMAQYRAEKGRGNPSGVRPGSRATRSPSPNTITNLGGFNGITQATAQSTWPSDINGSVGGIRVAQVVNQHLTVYPKSPLGSPATSDRSFNTITSSTASLFDPRIFFDPTWQRWVAQIEDGTDEYLLISTSNFPGGGYLVYRFNMASQCGASGFWDYPQIGMTQDAVVMTANCFSGNTYTGARVFGVAKAVVYNGYAFSSPVFSVASADGTTTPAMVYDQNPNMHLLSRSVHKVTFTNPATGFYSPGLTNTAITGFATPSTPRKAGQAGCTVASCTLDTSDGRFSSDSTQFSNQLWNVAAYGLSGAGTFSTPTWGQFNTDTNATTQFGTAFKDGCSDDFNPSIAVQDDGHAWLNWTSTDPQGSGCGQTFVRQEEAARQPGSPANTFPDRSEPFVSSFELTNNFDGNFGTQRWGDTSSISRDPSDVTKAWSWNQSVTSTNNTQANNEWGTRAQVMQNTP